jgi:hypothetical protein
MHGQNHIKCNITSTGRRAVELKTDLHIMEIADVLNSSVIGKMYGRVRRKIL